MEDPWPLFYCDYCERNVSAVRLACAECPDFDLCVECFSSGAEIGQHKKTHSYYLAYYAPLFTSHPNWTALEELKLIFQVGKSGYGNWNNIAEALNSKSCEETENHFHQIYVEGNLGKVFQSTIESYDIADHTADFVVESDSESSCENMPELVYEESGYVPRRGEFVTEQYDCNAESELYDQLNLDLDEDKISSAMRATFIEIYRNRIQKRNKVNKFLLDYDLFRKYETPTPKLDKDESLLREKMKLFCRFMPAAEYEDLISKMLEEKRIKAKIKDLQAEIQKRYSKDTAAKPVEKNSSKGRPKATTKQRKAALSASSSNLKSAPATGRKEAKSEPALPQESIAKECSVSDSAKEPSPINYATFLSKSEKLLCENLCMEPSCYIALKTTLLKERNVLKENGSVSLCSKFPKEMSDRVQEVVKFMEKSGWIGLGH